LLFLREFLFFQVEQKIKRKIVKKVRGN
jgi:hypothetical protein